MQIVRTVVWVLLLVGLLLFSIANWEPVVTVRIWEGVVLDTKIPAIVVISFLIGFVPMWLINRALVWQKNRKIASLENAARTAAATPIAVTPAGEPEGETVVTGEDHIEEPDASQRTDDMPSSDAPATYRSPGE